MPLPALDQLPGFRRRFRITPAAKSVHGEVEDDYHCMAVTIHHDGKTATAIEPVMDRAPWTICPGAVPTLQQTFAGVALEDFAARGEKRENCTHLHDLAVLAAAHAADHAPLLYDILVSDPIEGRRQAELRRNGTVVLGWVDAQYAIVEPEELAGVRLDKLRPWIESLDAQGQEAARLLQWGAILAHGRSRPLQEQSDARGMGVDRCYTFQSRRVAAAKRIGAIRDFSIGTSQPLERPL
ncbi:MAG: DUF2889 domain-containing protein [Steroidobacteraceae bacterium]